MKYLILTLSLLLAAPAQASVYLDTHGISKHLNTDMPFNEKNNGVGISWDSGERGMWSFGRYQNSMDKKSHYINYTTNFINEKNYRIGVITGLVTGYPMPVAPVVAPLISFGDTHRVNIGALPQIKGITPAVIFMNFQWRIHQ